MKSILIIRVPYDISDDLKSILKISLREITKNLFDDYYIISFFENNIDKIKFEVLNTKYIKDKNELKELKNKIEKLLEDNK